MNLIQHCVGRKQGKCYITKLANNNLKAQEYLKLKINDCIQQEKLMSNIVTPENGYLLYDAKRETKKYQDLLEILKGE